jgi:LysR family transcriptional regulator, transcription activator of glutamate synthase operon
VDTNGLRWFQQVADGMTVTELSDLEQRSQSGVSRALARLESEVGVPLLWRTGRTLRLTQAGSVFKRYVDALLHVLDDGLAALDALAAPDTGRVVLAFQPSLGTWLVPRLVAAFAKRFPAVQFQLVPVREEARGATLAGGSADVEVTTVRPSRDDVRWRPLASEPLRLALPAPGEAGPVDLGTCRDRPFVALRRGFPLRETLEQLCAGAGFAPDITLEADDLPTLTGLVRAGLGVTVLPAGHLERRGTPVPPDPDGLRLVPIADDAARRSIGVVWPRDRRLLPAAAEFFDSVVAALH